MMAVINGHPDRQMDERDLGMLELRHEGWTMSTIADRFGVSINVVSTQCRRIRERDREASGEDFDAGAYW